MLFDRPEKLVGRDLQSVGQREQRIDGRPAFSPFQHPDKRPVQMTLERKRLLGEASITTVLTQHLAKNDSDILLRFHKRQQNTCNATISLHTMVCISSFLSQCVGLYYH